MRTRLSDLAEQAGVSTATVSRVLNGKPGVASSTRQAVLAALDVLGYERPSLLRGRSAGLVGLIVPELTNPVFPAFAQAIESILAQRGYTPLLCTQAPGGTTEDEYVSTLVDHSVDGIVFISGLHADSRADHSRYELLRSQGVPIVLVNGYAPGIDAPFISPDDAASVDVALQHLVSLGHTRIGLAIGPERYVPSRRKLAAFTKGLVARGLAADERAAAEHTRSSLYTLEGGQAAAAELFESGHTAVVCASDLMALGAVRAARSRGLSVPGDVSVVGYDDAPLIAFTEPPLTTVRQPVEAMARAAVSALLTEIQGERAPRTELLFAPELVVRGSTGAVPRT
ncbi:LacI family transcriptional regulator [Isoptericola sp. NEAU-Y5]|uniref:LacI family transcriptional regulator n=1 Tax=Isoptericola luteus TaxID=2879484 RepID=A0ABS7ZIS1_9MICO|nr:LacI family DNA-binding transcriptional regulator [Isoptericola sp. NEAU-Y5]MCA5894925.1 LacI family transcriptional regulator [Isoptericola sp. NEAU-Y5]